MGIFEKVYGTVKKTHKCNLKFFKLNIGLYLTIIFSNIAVVILNTIVMIIIFFFIV